eukprot:m.113579 g.113579  ORF g.113579 m.113579 type:complete len:639 (+) comp9424_c0_seq4:95-2011(+)
MASARLTGRLVASSLPVQLGLGTRARPLAAALRPCTPLASPRLFQNASASCFLRVENTQRLAGSVRWHSTRTKSPKIDYFASKAYDPSQLLFVPLGGCNEVGMNLSLYHAHGKWIMVDLGVSFGDGTVSSLPVLADPKFIIPRTEDLAGLVLTHGHEDHIGAIAAVWPQLKCPVYTTAFTAANIRTRLSEEILNEMELHVVDPNARFRVGPFDIDMFPVSHSIPESYGLVLESDNRVVFHTGDWRFDDTPQVGNVTDRTALRKLSERNVLAIVGDSTNAEHEGSSGSEADVRRQVIELVGSITEGTIVASCFSTNIARIESFYHAAKQAGRIPCLMGRSMHRLFRIASETGYISNPGDFEQNISTIRNLPPNKRLILCTGCQGEQGSALWRLAARTNQIKLSPNDTIIFSSSVIPGNELSVAKVQNELLKQDLRLITDDVYHVSGHPCRDELREMYRLVKPQMLIPVHGAFSFLAAHAELAQEENLQTIIPENGAIIKISRDGPERVGTVPSGVLAMDGKQLRELTSATIAVREKIASEGICIVSLALDRDQEQPCVSLRMSFEGLENEGDPDGIINPFRLAVHAAINALPKTKRTNTDISKTVRKLLAKFCLQEFGKEPYVTVHILPVSRSSSDERA